MNTKPRNIRGTIHYSFLQGQFWMSFCLIVSYASYFLVQKGFSNTQTGIIVAVASGISALLQPLVGNLVDKSERISIHGIILGMALCMDVIAIILYQLKLSFLVLAVLYGLMITLAQTLVPLITSIGMYYFNRKIPINFGVARGVGSLCYALISLLVGSALEIYSESLLPLLLFFIYMGIGIATITFHFKDATETSSTQKRKEETSNLLFFQQHKMFMVSIVGITLVFTCHNMINSFLYQIAAYHGGGSAQMGVLSGIAALVELPTMFLFGYYLKLTSARNYIKISCAVFVIKALATLLSPNITTLYFVQLMQMFAFALFTVASVYYVNDIMEEKDRVKGQAYMAVTNTLGTVIGSLIGGWLIDTFEVPGMLLISTLLGVAGTIIVFATRDCN